MERIYFRRSTRVGLTVSLGEDDLPFLLKVQNDPEVMRFLMRRIPLYPEEERAWLKGLHKNVERNQVFGITLIETGELIGMMGLHRIDWVSRRASTSAWIASDAHRSIGLGSEAKLLLLDYAFNTLMLRKICSYVLATNTRSRRYNEKCGYKVEGTLARHTAVYGDYVDELAMAVFREDFAPIWEGTRGAV